MATVLPTPRLPVLIFGTHIAALGVLRALAKRGVPTRVVDATPNIIMRSRWYRPAERTLSETPDSERLAAFLGSLELHHAVLIPCSDQWALAVAGLPEGIRQRFPASVANREVIEQFVDKDRFRALVDRLGIPRPRTMPLRNPADLVGATDDELTNGFLKPTESALHNRRFGTKGFFVHSREQAAHLIEEANAAGITFMLQEWIPGDVSKTILIDGFVDRHGTVVSMVARRRVRMDPPKLANTCTDVTIPLSEVSACISPLRTLLADVGYRGVFNIEFKFDDRDGQFKVIEVNPRPFWLVGHIARAGLDLPWMSYLDAQELPVPVPAPYQIGRYGRYEIPDAAAVFRAWSSGHRPEGPVLAPWLRGDRALFWWRDPMPAVADLSQILGRRVVRTLGRSGRAHGRA